MPLERKGGQPLSGKGFRSSSGSKSAGLPSSSGLPRDPLLGPDGGLWGPLRQRPLGGGEGCSSWPTGSVFLDRLEGSPSPVSEGRPADVRAVVDTEAMPSMPALVEPQMLEWARRSANLEPIAVARRIKVPEGRIEEWERGEKRPTIAQLRKAASLYKRPLAVFYLSEPPKDYETLRDFRRLDPGESSEWSAALHSEYRRAHFQRDAVLEIAELDDETLATDWRIDRLPATDAALARAARERLKSTANRELPKASSREHDHLGYWTRALENAGVLILATQGGQVAETEMRAFSLYFDEVPVIMLNGKDAPRGRLFSLLHEYVHLLLHTEGLCDVTTDQRAVSDNRRLEARCNAVAAEILMPEDAVLTAATVTAHDAGEPWSLPDLVEAARPFGVSAEALLRRLVTLGQASLAEYQSFREEQQSAPKPKKKSKGGNPYATKVRDFGKGYVRRVSRAHRRSLIDSATAAEHLDAKVDHFARLEEAAGA